MTASSHPGYARLLRRIQALAIDGVVFGLALFGTLMLVDSLGVDVVWIKIASVASVLLGLDIGLVSFTGGTIGHHIAQIRVADQSTHRHINPFRALVRSITKFALGWGSIFFVFVSRQHQALHDKLVGSVVLVKDHAKVATTDRLPERSEDYESTNHSSWWRRILVGVLYFLLAYTVLSTAVIFLVSTTCSIQGQCTDAENMIFTVVSALIGLTLALCLYLGWTGRLYGCRRKPS